MAIRERLVYAIDVVTDGASKGLSNFRSSVSQAEGTVGKFKAGVSSGFAAIQGAAGGLAVAGGAALVAFGAKAVGAFQETALEAGKFADATGLAVEDASRWLEVAGDMGVEASVVEGSFTKLNQAIGKGNPVLKQYGIGLITASDGTADVNQTMLTAIQRIGAIKDPTERAAAAQAAFGKSYKEAAEIVLGNADELKKKLDAVSDAKVINQDELKKAREFRDAIENLKDISQDLTVQVGESLVPALTSLAENLKTINDIASDSGFSKLLSWSLKQPTALETVDKYYKKVGTTVRGIFGNGGDAPEAIKYTTTAVDQYVESLEHSHQAVISAASEQEKYNDTLAKSQAQAESYVALLTGKAVQAYYDIQHAVERARKANKLYTDSLEAQRDEIQRQIDTLYDLETAQYDTADAVQSLHDTMDDTSSTMEDVRRAQIDAAEAAKAQADAFAEATGASDGSTASYLAQKLELQRLKEQFPELAADIDNYIAKLNAIPGVVSTQLLLTANGRAYTAQQTSKFGRIIDAVGGGGAPKAAGATGAIVTRPTNAMIGEAGPEAVIPLNRMPGASPLGAAGGATYNITVNASGDVVPDRIVDAIKKYERMNGNGWRS